MIQEIVKQWEANKGKLEEWFKENEKHSSLEYKDIVEAIFTLVVKGYDAGRIHEIDDGHYQGTLIYIIPENTYQPSVDEYLTTCIYYGSCSGCDTLLGIKEEGDWDSPITEHQVKEYMTLALHIIQDLHPLREKNV